ALLAGDAAPTVLRAVSVIGIPFAVLTGVYTAFLFAQAKARALWQNPLLPPHHVVQSLLTGGATALAMAVVLEPGAVDALSLVVGLALGPVGLLATALALALAWAYSAPPLRLKANGWWGNAACGISYEGIAWLTGAAIMAGGVWPESRSLLLAALYSVGTHGIMTLNDFKAIDGDRRMGVRSLPVQLGVQRAARVACAIMLLPQAVVVGLLLQWGQAWHALAVAALMVVQARLMQRLLRDVMGRARWYSGVGVPLFVAGMMVSAFALRGASLG
ncbi:MAG: UbiA family prenyltransferase, partial [Burkholderiaceae bacterium]